MITTIRLSTGNTVNIPVLQALSTDSGMVTLSRAINPLYVKAGGGGGGSAYLTPYTDAELIELWNMVSGQSCSLMDRTQSVPEGFLVGFPAWYYDKNTDKYKLLIGLTGNNTTVSYQATPFGYSSFYYWNSYCDTMAHVPAYPYPDWYLGIESETVPPQPIYNIREGAYYTLDIYTNGNYQYVVLPGGSTFTESTVRTNIDAYIAANPDEGIDYDDTVSDYSNPYGIVVSEPGGGDGAGTGADIETIDKMEVPDLPTIDVNNCGFITTYYATLGQIRSLANFLWSNAFDLDTFKKLFSDPMQCIIGLGIVPIQPVVTGTQTVHFGDIDSGIAMSTCAQYAQLDCGSVNIKPYIGSFLDYAPYVNISIYLPYIGIRELSADDVMNDTVSVTYNVDVLTGGCAAIVSTAKKGVLYQFNGNCITNVPLTSVNYAAAIQNAVTAVGSVASLAAGVATGAAPLTMAGVAGLANSAANVACNSKQTVQRSGNMGGSAGMLSVQTPYLIINRPKLSVPDKLNKYTGNTANMTMALNSVKGFTMIDYIHLDGIACTDAERNELLSILKEGVIF